MLIRWEIFVFQMLFSSHAEAVPTLMSPVEAGMLMLNVNGGRLFSDKTNDVYKETK